MWVQSIWWDDFGLTAFECVALCGPSDCQTGGTRGGVALLAGLPRPMAFILAALSFSWEGGKKIMSSVYTWEIPSDWWEWRIGILLTLFTLSLRLVFFVLCDDWLLLRLQLRLLLLLPDGPGSAGSLHRPCPAVPCCSGFHHCLNATPEQTSSSLAWTHKVNKSILASLEDSIYSSLYNAGS